MYLYERQDLFITSTYLINIAFPASVLTGSTSFQDSLKVFLVSRDKEMETVLNPNAPGMMLRCWNDAEQPIVNTSVCHFLEKFGNIKEKLKDLLTTKVPNF